MGFRPVYDTYVDVVIEHLGGKSFRETAVEELLARFLNKMCIRDRQSRGVPQRKPDGGTRGQGCLCREERRG